MRRFILLLALTLASAGTALPAAACVGKTLIVGADSTAEGQLTAQVIAILINERTGTTVKIRTFDDEEELYRELTGGEVDITVECAGRALNRLGLEIPSDPAAAYTAAKAAHLAQLNLVWLPPLGFQGPETGAGPAAPVAKKETLKKFPALPRLIAKTHDLLSNAALEQLLEAGEPSRVAREFLREKKLI